MAHYGVARDKFCGQFQGELYETKATVGLVEAVLHDDPRAALVMRYVISKTARRLTVVRT